MSGRPSTRQGDLRQQAARRPGIASGHKHGRGAAESKEENEHAPPYIRRPSVFDRVGARLVLLVSGGLLFWGYSFANNSVHDQLAAQKIFFPPKGSDALKPPEIGRYLNQYAGQQLTTGAQAQAYANHFIAVHLKAE